MTQLLTLNELAGTSEEGNLFPKNWRFSFIDGVLNIERTFISLDQIRFDNDKNAARAAGRDASLVTELQNSFSLGVDTTQFIPIIEKLAVPEIER